jgi:transposase-like protein
MDAARFEDITHEIAADATVQQLVVLEAHVRALLADRVAEALVARRTVELAEVRSCPRCGHRKVVRHGRDAAGRQRFRCLPINGNGCGRTFNALTATAFSRMRKPELWLTYAQLLADGLSLNQIVDKNIGISRLTAWRWRHRLLGALAPRRPDRLGGIVEVDETFFLRRFKGHRGWKRGNPPEDRPPRYRGSGALLPGISWQQVPVLTAVDRNGRHVDAVMERRVAHEALAILLDALEPGSLLCSDDWKAYRQVARKAQCEHRIIRPTKDDWLKKAMGHPPRTAGRIGLGRVNAHHEATKTLINRIHRGVSSHYLPAYLTLLRTKRTSRPASPKALLQRALKPA